MSKKNQGPLLYIHQPFARTPVTNMQDVFTTKEEIQAINKEEQISKKKKTLKEHTEALDHNSNEESLDQQTSIIHDSKHGTGFKRVKPFKEMDIEEKLGYLINFPKVLPPVPCIFHTQTENYQGILKELKDDQIFIQNNQDQTTKSILMSELTNITMSGIRSH